VVNPESVIVITSHVELINFHCGILICRVPYKTRGSSQPQRPLDLSIKQEMNTAERLDDHGVLTREATGGDKEQSQ